MKNIAVLELKDLIYITRESMEEREMENLLLICKHHYFPLQVYIGNVQLS